MSAGPVQVSVIMPAYNAAAYIAESIQSVLDQDFPSYELIVVDDGSTDTTADVIRSFGGRVIYLRQANSGGCSAPRNHGARLARGAWLTFLDSDDLMLTGKLAQQVRALRQYPDIACVVGDYRNFNSQGAFPATHFDSCHELSTRLGGAQEVILEPLELRAILVDENFGSACSPLFRREAFEALGGFDESLGASEDFDLLYRAALAGPLMVQRTVGFARRLHDTNMSNNAERILRIKAESRAKLAGLEPNRELRQRLRTAATGYQLGLVEELGRRGRTWEAVKALGGVPPGGWLASRQSLRALAWTVASLAR